MSTIRLGKLSLAEVLRLFGEARESELRVGMPGTIESFDGATQLASVRPCLKDTVVDEEGNESALELPVISDVPCHFPGGAGFSMTFPVKKGDPCWLSFADRSIDKWLDSGGVVDPVAMQTHHLTDAACFPGVRAKPGAIPDFDQDHFTIGKDGEASQFAALANLVKSEISSLRDWCNTFKDHQHTGTVAGAACTTTATTPPAVAPSAVGDVGSATVKIKG